jgi:hypothetical protein
MGGNRLSIVLYMRISASNIDFRPSVKKRICRILLDLQISKNTKENIRSWNPISSRTLFHSIELGYGGWCGCVGCHGDMGVRLPTDNLLYLISVIPGFNWISSKAVNRVICYSRHSYNCLRFFDFHRIKHCIIRFLENILLRMPLTPLISFQSSVVKRRYWVFPHLYFVTPYNISKGLRTIYQTLPKWMFPLSHFSRVEIK